MVAQQGGECVPFAADVTKEVTLAAAIEAAQARWGRLAALLVAGGTPIASVDGNGTLVTYLPELQQEWNFWMEDTDALLPGQDYHNSVRLADGTLLNRYWDTRDAPRDESYKEDVQTASTSGQPAPLVDRNLWA